jgi:hypothetical protein
MNFQQNSSDNAVDLQRNDMGEYLCSLSSTYTRSKNIFTSLENDKDPFQKYLKQEYTINSNKNVNAQEMDSIHDASNDNVSPSAMFDKYSQIFERKSFSQSLRMNNTKWQAAVQQWQLEKKKLLQQGVLQKKSNFSRDNIEITTGTTSETITETASNEIKNETVVISDTDESKKTIISANQEAPIETKNMLESTLPKITEPATLLNTTQKSLSKPRKIKPTMKMKSTLSASEHREYLDMLKKMNESKESYLKITKSGRFIELNSKVEKEQQQFKQAMFEEATMDVEKYKRIHEAINRQVDTVIKEKKQRIATLPPLYSIVKSIDISDIRVAYGIDPILRFQRQLLRIGKCRQFRPHIFTNDMHFQRDIDLFYHETISTLKPKSENPTIQNQPTQEEAKLENTQHKKIEISNYLNESNKEKSNQIQSLVWKKPRFVSVSDDPIITNYLIKFIKPNEFKSNTIFILSSSTFQEIIGAYSSHSLSDEWTIPVKITTNAHGLKCIFLEKPLLKKVYTLREKNDMYYKVAIKSFGLNLTKDAYVIDYNEDEVTQQFLKDAHSRMEEENISLNDTNLNYSMFELGLLRILVRYHNDGFVPDTTPQKYRNITLRARMEYLGKKNQEEITRSEAARYWARTYIRKDVELYLGRINIKNNSVQRIDQLGTASEILSSTKFEPSQSIKLFNILLHELELLTPGFTYLVRHSPGSPLMNIMIESGVEKQAATLYNLAEDYKNAGKTDLITAHYIPRIWVDKPGQIKYTFPIASESKKKEKKGKRKRSKGGKHTSTKGNNPPINPVTTTTRSQ